MNKIFDNIDLVNAKLGLITGLNGYLNDIFAMFESFNYKFEMINTKKEVEDYFKEDINNCEMIIREAKRYLLRAFLYVINNKFIVKHISALLKATEEYASNVQKIIEFHIEIKEAFDSLRFLNQITNSENHTKDSIHMCIIFSF